ncbi:gibberellin-regulated protein 14-like [Vicia villosa]|uniref:gibberellin-regulated protein 14-like n=1 Tax=Vicia villosa TaxID=3911 RepID=UPI00273B1F05|nr:gibberellin-regulated protein 14-like [Vicia villosa]
MLQKMASKSILLLAIFLVVATKVYSYEEDLKIVVNYANPSAPSVQAPPVKPSPTPVVTAPTPPSPVKTPPTTPPPVNAPLSPPLSKTPYQTPPIVKPPSPLPVTAPTQPPTSQPPVAKTPLAPPTPFVKSLRDCIPLCGYRCQLHSRKNLCLRACVTCCNRCKCVPPGTYGNREKCGKCYTDMLTRGNRYKCP